MHRREKDIFTPLRFSLCNKIIHSINAFSREPQIRVSIYLLKWNPSVTLEIQGEPVA